MESEDDLSSGEDKVVVTAVVAAATTKIMPYFIFQTIDLLFNLF